jgi:hypothetical protein
LIGGVVLLTGVGVVAGLLAGWAGWRPAPTEPSVARQIAGFVLIVAGLVLEITALVHLFRVGHGAGSQSPLRALNRRDRRRAFGQIRGRLPITAAEEPLLLDVAVRLRGQRRTGVVFSGLAVLLIGQAVAGGGLWRLVLSLVGCGLLVVAVGVIERDARHAEAFLRRHQGAGSGDRG